MAHPVLTLRELNRATLARQLLLNRSTLPIPDAIERLVGLQAQVPSPPYIGLWTRLRDFRREDLTRLMDERQVVRATLMRSTLHLMTAKDYLLLRPALQPALTRALNSFFGKRAKGLDIDRLVAAAQEYLKEPRTFGELGALLSEIEPGRDPAALAYAARTYLQMVQVPSGGSRWGYSNRPPYVTAGSWLRRSVSGSEDPRGLVLRYLAAFGPATVKDVQTWSGLVRLKGRIEEMKSELRVFHDERGNELLDLPGMPLPEDLADLPAPPRFVPEYDNLVLGHADRTRVVPGEYRSSIFLSAARVRATFLVDGFVRGTWKIEKAQRVATLVIEPFELLAQQDRDALAEEGERLVRFIEDGAEAFEIRFAE